MEGERIEETERVQAAAGGAMGVNVGVVESENGGGVRVKVRGPWSTAQDAILTELVRKFGPRNWSMIAAGIPGRSGKSCRLRWCNQLNPCLKRKPFTCMILLRTLSTLIVLYYAIASSSSSSTCFFLFCLWPLTCALHLLSFFFFFCAERLEFRKIMFSDLVLAFIYSLFQSSFR